MSTSRITRINELIQHEVAQQLYRVINDPAFDPAAVTVTHVFTGSDLRHSKVLVSIRGTPERQRELMRIIHAHRGALQAVVGKQVVLKYTPRLNFELDPSVAEGDRVLGLISKLEDEHPDWRGPDPDPTPSPDPEEPAP